MTIIETSKLKHLYEAGRILQQDIEIYLRAYPNECELTDHIQVNKVTWDTEKNMLFINYGDRDLYNFGIAPDWFKEKFIHYCNELLVQRIFKFIKNNL